MRAALSEIRAAARHDPASAAEGAVLLLEKLSPALSQVDSSSGALGNATYGAVQALVPIIAEADVSDKVRSKWLDRLFTAIQNDDPPYIESLGDHWGDLCVTAECASRWADDLVPMLRRVQEERRRGVFAWMSGAGVCYSALFKAGRHDELFGLLGGDRDPIWPYRVWGGRVFLARGQIDEHRLGQRNPLGLARRFDVDIVHAETAAAVEGGVGEVHRVERCDLFGQGHPNLTKQCLSEVLPEPMLGGILQRLDAQWNAEQAPPHRHGATPLDVDHRREVIGHQAEGALCKALTVLIDPHFVQQLQRTDAEQRDEHQHRKHAAINAQED